MLIPLYAISLRLEPLIFCWKRFLLRLATNQNLRDWLSSLTHFLTLPLASVIPVHYISSVHNWIVLELNKQKIWQDSACTNKRAAFTITSYQPRRMVWQYCRQVSWFHVRKMTSTHAPNDLVSALSDWLWDSLNESIYRVPYSVAAVSFALSVMAMKWRALLSGITAKNLRQHSSANNYSHLRPFLSF